MLDRVGHPAKPDSPGDEECLIISPDGGHRVLFVEVPDDKTVKNRGNEFCILRSEGEVAATSGP